MSIFAFLRDDIVRSVQSIEPSGGLSALDIAEAIRDTSGLDRVEDITNVSPQPQPGWHWPEGRLPFSAGPHYVPPRVIDKSDLIQRFTSAEWEAIVSNASSKAQAFRSWVLSCGSVWLDHPRLIESLEDMVAAGVLTADRPDQIRGLA